MNEPQIVVCLNCGELSPGVVGKYDSEKEYHCGGCNQNTKVRPINNVLKGYKEEKGNG